MNKDEIGHNQSIQIINADSQYKCTKALQALRLWVMELIPNLSSSEGHWRGFKAGYINNRNDGTRLKFIIW
jgi:hypothetical protein